MGRRRAGTDRSGWPRGVAAILAVCLLSGACATFRKTASPPRSADVIVLLPDDRGKTGAIVVTGPGGSELLLDKPRQAVAVTERSGAGTPYTLAEEELRSMVGPALSSLPARPKTYRFYFVRDEVVLTVESRAAIQEALRDIAHRNPVEISTVGHTDTLGTRRHNQQLGLERARMVADLIVRAGIDRSIVRVSSHGEGNLLVPTGDEVPEPRNRRVELTVR